MGNVCYHSVCNLSSCRLLWKEIKIIILGTVILHVVYTKVWKMLAHMREKHMQTIFKHWALRKMWLKQGRGKKEVGKNSIMRRLIICTPHKTLFRCSA